MLYNDRLVNERKFGRGRLIAALALAPILVLALAGCTGVGVGAAQMGALDLLTYSIYNQGALTPAELDNTTLLIMLNGKPVVVTNEGGKIMLNGKINITGSAIQACNGVIYVIDDSLVPAAANSNNAPAAAGPGSAVQPVAPTSCAKSKTIADILSADTRFSEFVRALKNAGLLDALDQPGAFTVFAAPNEVFAEQVAAPAGGSSNTITICHATGSDKNPYVAITVDVHGLAGHSHHDGDIIPAPAEGCPTSGATPTPTLTETPTETEAPTEIPTEIPGTQTFPAPTP